MLEAAVQNQAGKQSRIIYDWVSICFKNKKADDVYDVVELLGLGSLKFQEINGAHGYRDRLYSDCISIHYNGREDMGVWLEMSGKGCRIFEKFGTGDYDTLLKMCANPDNNMNLTRLDVAFDDFEGLLDIDRICDDARQKNVVTRFHEESWEVIYGGKGNTVNLGSKKSDIFVRIYDKDAEQGHEDGRHWVRVELQLRRDRAIGFVKAEDFCESIGKRYLGVIANYVRFVEPSEDSNKRRWATTDYWQKFLDNAAAISIYEKPEIEYTIDQLESFVINQAGNAVDTYIKIRGVDAFLEDLKKRGTNQNPKYIELISKMKEPEPISNIPVRELTDEEMRDEAYHVLIWKEHNFKYPLYDEFGKRWFRCSECGDLHREDEVPVYGGEMGQGYGVCNACLRELHK